MNLILAKILKEKDLDTWSKLKSQYFSPPYSNIYALINKHYEKYGELPSFEELEVSIRDKASLSSIKALKEIEVPEIDNDVLLDSLINEYAQEIALDNIEKLVDKIAFKDSIEIVEELNALAFHIEEQTEGSEQVVFMNDFTTLDEQEMHTRVPLGLSNDFDHHTMGLGLSEMIMFGGFRGSGKSIICSNLVCNQYEAGHSSLYFSIEMRAREIYERNMAMLAQVKPQKIRSGNLTDEEKWRIMQVRAGMVQDKALDLLEQYRDSKDLNKFEQELRRRPLNPKNQMITIDNPRLTLANIDATISKFKNKLGDDLSLIVVDYINQISETDMYDWKTQIHIAKRLKEMARKYDVIMAAPYQTDDKGQVRFSKGLLIPTDWAFTVEANKVIQGSDKDSLSFKCEKVRNGPPFNFESAIDWDILRIQPHTNYYNSDISVAKGMEILKKQPKKAEKSSDDLSV